MMWTLSAHGVSNAPPLPSSSKSRWLSEMQSQTNLWDTEEYHDMATQPKLTEDLVCQKTFTKAVWASGAMRAGPGGEHCPQGIGSLCRVGWFESSGSMKDIKTLTSHHWVDDVQEGHVTLQLEMSPWPPSHQAPLTPALGMPSQSNSIQQRLKIEW